MADPAQHLPPEQEKRPEGAVPAPIVPQLPAPQSTSASFAQMTQVAGYVPHNVWNTQALLDLHQKQFDMGISNNRLLDDQRKRENKIAYFVLTGVGLILAVGFLFTYLRIDFGRDIVVSTISAALGYLGGYGAGLTKRT